MVEYYKALKSKDYRVSNIKQEILKYNSKGTIYMPFNKETIFIQTMYFQSNFILLKLNIYPLFYSIIIII